MTSVNQTAPAHMALANVAADENKLFHSAYVQGVAKFIKECATPMTMAIQGDTGTGKTTLINLIEKELRAEAQPGAQDNPDEVKYCDEIIGVAVVDVLMQSTSQPNSDLFIYLLTKIIPKLKDSDLLAVADIGELASTASEIVTAVNVEEDKGEDKGLLSSILDAIFAPADNAKATSENNVEREAVLKSISELKEAFAEALQQSAERNGKAKDARLVVFIDGLDHINPETSLNLMEQVVTFISCPRCVFVFAVDEKIVCEGIRERHGGRIDNRRQKMIYDKLVLTPIFVPTYTYNLNRFIRDLLQTEGEKQYTDEFVDVIDTLLRSPTPYRIKRYLNSMYLYRDIFNQSGQVDDSLLPALFAAVILRIECSEIFSEIAKCAQGSEEDFAENLKALLESSEPSDEVNLAKLPALWNEGADVDVEKRSNFLSWIREAD